LDFQVFWEMFWAHYVGWRPSKIKEVAYESV